MPTHTLERVLKIGQSLAMAIAVGLFLSGCGTACQSCRQAALPDNTLSPTEKREGWKLLFDGTGAEQFRSARYQHFPTNAWHVRDGLLVVEGNGGGEARDGGDIITRERFSDFELQVDFLRTSGCNSGIKIFVQPNLDPVTGHGGKASTGSAIGLEYQILDDATHPDAKLGRNGNRQLGALYDLIPAGVDKHVNPMGEWNHALIISRGTHVEHWLNGKKIVEYDRGSAAFREAVAGSKFKNIPGFGEWKDGHILLQEHGSVVSFKNIKLRLLKAP